MTPSTKASENNIYIRIAQACAYAILDRKEYQFILFGSRAMGTDTDFSDYDFGILGENPIQMTSYHLLKSVLD